MPSTLLPWTVQVSFDKHFGKGCQECMSCTGPGKKVRLEQVPNNAAAMWSVLLGTIGEGQWHLRLSLMSQLF